MALSKPQEGDAEADAIRVLGWLAGEPELMARFLAMSGIEAGDIRHAAAEPGFLAGVVQFVAAHEPTLLSCAAGTGIEPARLTGLARMLPSGDDRYEAST